MAKTSDYYTPLEPNCYYHVYNRTVGKQDLFLNQGNYEFFLRKYDEYLSNYIDTYAFCSLNNHFHLLIFVKPWESILEKFRKLEEAKLDLTTFENLSNLEDKKPSDIISHQFQKFFQSYSMAFNKQHGRVGTLFQTPFKRSWIDNNEYLKYMVYYIHSNPLKHSVFPDFQHYKWSSYHRVLDDKPTKLMKKEVILWFGNKEKYMKFHTENQNLDNIKNFKIDGV
ncbi:transposase [Emticicia sp.]|uniref:transposase n=1 Tax=Emticicia sp. TaxID=1930953 RepID=UPI0037513A88